MTFLIISFLAGVLTVLAPCVLPLLPVIIGGSVSGTRKSKPFIIALSLSVSVIVFTFLLKVSTVFISIPPQVWSYISGIIIIFFGLTLIFPALWEKVFLKFNLFVSRKGNTLLAEGVQKESVKGDILIGAALGPVFSTCSPTYFVILATVLPQSFVRGFVYLLAYVLGLSIMLLLISILGQKLISKLEGASNPHGKIKKTLGVLFLLVGVFIMSGLDKKIQTAVINSGVFDITRVEQKLLELSEKKDLDTEIDVNTVSEEETSLSSENDDDVNKTEATPSSNQKETTKASPPNQSKSYLSVAEKQKRYKKYVDISKPSGFVNSEAFTLKDYIGKKVIMVDFMTYSCINCQRTFPYLKTWYETYEKDGFLIVDIHTPEFAFEKDINNVRKAMKDFGLNFPIVLDNDYGTWNAYSNIYWPRKYLIDIDGFVVYDHIGEGEYSATEKKIQELLEERAYKLGSDMPNGDIVSNKIEETNILSRSPETYFGAFRNTNLANGVSGKEGIQKFEAPESSSLSKNKLYLDGSWNIKTEYAEAGSNAKAFFKFEASKVFIVAESQTDGTIEVYSDSRFVGTISIKDSKLYTLIDQNKIQNSLLELRISSGVRLFAFTFG